MKEKVKKLHTPLKKYGPAYVLIAPFVLLFTMFTIVPIITTFVLGFSYFNGMSAPQWRGLGNYIRMFLYDDVFLIAVKNTLVFAFLTGPLGYFISFFFAWFINEMVGKARTFITLVFYTPSLVGGSVIIIWKFIFSGDRLGLVNGTLVRFGIIQDAIQWFQDPTYNLSMVIIVQLWISLGAGFLAFIAGFKTVDPTLYEAGIIDGVKNRFQELVYITIPAMKNVMLFGAVMQIAASFAAGTIAITLGGFPSTNYSLRTIISHILDYGQMRFELGYASAMAFLLSVIMIITRKIIYKLLRSDT